MIQSEDQRLLIICLSGTLLLALGLYMAYKKQSKFLEIDTKWLALVLSPLIIFLILTGRVKEIDAFGLTIKTQFAEGIEENNLLDTSINFTKTVGTLKSGMSELGNLSPAKKKRIDRLIFREDGDYVDELLDQYMSELPNLQFFEIRSARNKFVCLIDLQRFGKRKENVTDFLNKLMKREGQGDNGQQQGLPHFDPAADYYVDVAIYDDLSIEETLKRFRENGYPNYIIKLQRDQVVGLISKTDLLEKIGNTVLRANDE